MSARQNIGKFEYAISLVSKLNSHGRLYMNSSFKLNFMLSVLTVGFSFLEEIKPCQFEIQNFSAASSVKFQNSCQGRFQFAGSVMFLFGDFRC